MRAALLTIGDELLSGRTRDVHLAYLAPRLAALGIDVVEARTVGDEAQAIQSAVWELQERRGARVVVTTGGLGPTHDDRTVAAVAALHGAALVEHAPTWRHIQARAARAHDEGRREAAAPGAAARRMALVPRGAHVFPNDAGSAPGLALERLLRTRAGTAWTLVLPGVPQELEAIWKMHAEPFLSMLVAGRERARVHVELDCHAREADVARLLAAVQDEHPAVRIGSYPTHGRIEIRLRVSGSDRAAVEAAVAALRERLAGSGVEVVPTGAGSREEVK